MATLSLIISLLIEFGVGIGAIAFWLFLILGFGSALGLVYLVFWLLESLGLLNENPADYFIHNILFGWLESFSLLDIFRAPLIWMEYTIAVSLGYSEFILDDDTKLIF